LVAIVLARAVRRAAVGALTRRRADASVTVLLGNLAQVLVLACGALIVLALYTEGAFGWILTSLSALGIVVGLSLQDLLRNFFAGIWMLVERPFRLGDTVEIGGYTGAVEGISFRTTQLRTVDGREVILPNATLMTSAVVNLSRYPLRRATLWLAVPARGADAVDAQSIRAALGAAGAVAIDPPPAVDLRSVSDGQARFQVTFWAGDRDAALTSALAAVRARFPEGEVHSA
jgi:small-conductance mechanosensitive channel